MRKVVAAVANPSMSRAFSTMNAFEKFDLPLTLDIDIAKLEHKYFEAQLKFHPDQINSLLKEQKSEAANHAADYNEAYRILKDPLKRAYHLLKSMGWIDISGSETEQDLDLLNFIVEMNERIAEANTNEEKEVSLLRLKEEIKQSWIALNDAILKKDQSYAVNIFSKLRYLKRMQQNLEQV